MEQTFIYGKVIPNQSIPLSGLTVRTISGTDYEKIGSAISLENGDFDLSFPNSETQSFAILISGNPGVDPANFGTFRQNDLSDSTNRFLFEVAPELAVDPE